MIREAIRATALISVLIIFAVEANARGNPAWTSLAVNDINAAHDLILQNHPGPVDENNPGFETWLETGRVKALRLAGVVRDRADLVRSVRFYINGFRDGHLSVHETAEVVQTWPGFLTATSADGHTIVTSIAENSPVKIGSQLLTCDGKTPTTLLDDRVHPYRTNADIPHQRLLTASYLFIVDADDVQSRLMHCTFMENGRRLFVDLRWREIDHAQLESKSAEAQGTVIPPLGLRNVNGVWLVSLPSFNWWGQDAAKMQAMVDELGARASELHQANYVVIDVRGNRGGNSEWGEKVAYALWGQPAIDSIEHSFDWTTDWRVSRQNIRLTREAAARARTAGLTEDAESREKIATGMEGALGQGSNFYRVAESPTTTGLPSDYRSPFAGKVYFLSDLSCASACLNFADIMRRLPDVTHIGLPTSADAVYIDNVVAPLPSGYTELSYSLKVYRNRVRKNNEWYEPSVHWPGGAMTDRAIADWVREIP